MPELPEVEVLVRHLAPLLRHRTIREVEVRRPKILRPTREPEFRQALVGARFADVTRRGKYLLFALQHPARGPVHLLGHLGMTGRMYLQPARAPLPTHAAVVFKLGRAAFVFEDTRYFGRLTLDTSTIDALGPEPLSAAFTADYLEAALLRSAQAIKLKLLDQSLLAGVGNIYGSEALFCARINPRRPARQLSRGQTQRLWRCLRRILAEAIAWGSTAPLDWRGQAGRDNLFYYGRAPDAPNYFDERLRVYDREGQPCPRCRTAIRRIPQGGRSTYYCPRCQRG
jgi:formamidopyrimidine-DNA glycosylase